MKSAEPQDQQLTRPTNPTSRPRHNNAAAADLRPAITKLGHWLVKIITFPVQLFTWLTNPSGSAIILGIGVVYFALLNIEGYWQSLPAASGIKPPFLQTVH